MYDALPKTAMRRQAEGAREAYEAALEIFIGTAMSEDQEREIWARVAPIREWLESEGLLKR